MADFWRDLIWTAVRDTTNTLSVVMPGVLAMLALVVLGAAPGPLGPMARAAVRVRDSAHRDRDRPRHGSGRLRHPLRRARARPGARLRPRRSSPRPPHPGARAAARAGALGPRDHQPHLNGRPIAGCSRGTSPVIAERHTVGGGA